MPWVSSRSSSSASASAVARFSHERLGGRRARGQLRFEQAERHRDRDEPLLGAVVQIALDSPPLGVGRLDQPRARRLELEQPRPELGLEALVLEREARGRAHGPHELGVVLQHGVVQQHGDRLSVALDERRAAPAVVIRELDRSAVGVDVALLGSEPEGELERRVAQRPRERLAQIDGGARSAQLDDEPRDHAARQPPLQEHEQHRDWHGRHQGEVRVRGKRTERIADAGRRRPSSQARRAWRTPPRAPARPRGAALRSPAASVGRAARSRSVSARRRSGAGGPATRAPCGCRGPPAAGCSHSRGSAGRPCCRTASPVAGGRARRSP